MKVIEQDIDLWEIWIEYDPFHPEYFGTLYVHGETASSSKSTPRFVKLDADLNHQLVLQLPERASNLNYTREVFYSEPIRNLNRYTSVCIYAGSKLLGCFEDIEIMI